MHRREDVAAEHIQPPTSQLGVELDLSLLTRLATDSSLTIMCCLGKANYYSHHMVQDWPSPADLANLTDSLPSQASLIMHGPLPQPLTYQDTTDTSTPDMLAVHRSSQGMRTPSPPSTLTARAS